MSAFEEQEGSQSHLSDITGPDDWAQVLREHGPEADLSVLEFWCQKRNRSSGLFGGRGWVQRHIVVSLLGDIGWAKSEAASDRHCMSFLGAQIKACSLDGKPHCITVVQSATGEALSMSLPSAEDAQLALDILLNAQAAHEIAARPRVQAASPPHAPSARDETDSLATPTSDTSPAPEAPWHSAPAPSSGAHTEEAPPPSPPQHTPPPPIEQDSGAFQDTHAALHEQHTAAVPAAPQTPSDSPHQAPAEDHGWSDPSTHMPPATLPPTPEQAGQAHSPSPAASRTAPSGSAVDAVHVGMYDDSDEEGGMRTRGHTVAKQFGAQPFAHQAGSSASPPRLAQNLFSKRRLPRPPSSSDESDSASHSTHEATSASGPEQVPSPAPARTQHAAAQQDDSEPALHTHAAPSTEAAPSWPQAHTTDTPSTHPGAATPASPPGVRRGAGTTSLPSLVTAPAAGETTSSSSAASTPTLPSDRSPRSEHSSGVDSWGQRAPPPLGQTQASGAVVGNTLEEALAPFVRMPWHPQAQQILAHAVEVGVPIPASFARAVSNLQTATSAAPLSRTSTRRARFLSTWRADMAGNPGMALPTTPTRSMPLHNAPPTTTASSRTARQPPQTDGEDVAPTARPSASEAAQLRQVLHAFDPYLRFVFAWAAQHGDSPATSPADSVDFSIGITAAAFQATLVDAFILPQSLTAPPAAEQPSLSAAAEADLLEVVQSPPRQHPPHTPTLSRDLQNMLEALFQTPPSMQDECITFNHCKSWLVLVARQTFTGRWRPEGSLKPTAVQSGDATLLQQLCSSYIVPWADALRTRGSAWTSCAVQHHFPPQESHPFSGSGVSRMPLTPAAPPKSTHTATAAAATLPTPPPLPTTSPSPSASESKAAQHNLASTLPSAEDSPTQQQNQQPADLPSWLCTEAAVFSLLAANAKPLEVVFNHYAGGNALITPPALLRLLIDFNVVPTLVSQTMVMECLLATLQDDALAEQAGSHNTPTLPTTTSTTPITLSTLSLPRTKATSTAGSNPFRSPLQARYALTFHAGGAGAPAVRRVRPALVGRAGLGGTALYADLYEATVGTGYADTEALASLPHFMELLPRLARLAYATTSAAARQGHSRRFQAAQPPTQDCLRDLLLTMSAAAAGKRVLWAARGAHLPRFAVFADRATTIPGHHDPARPVGLAYLQGREVGRGGRPRPNWK